MKKEFVTYEQALALKELGFNGFCLGLFSQNHDNELFTDFKRNPLEGFVPNKCVEAPLKQQVFRWFREKHNLHHEIEFNGDEYLAYVNGLTANIFKTYEEAESACIDKLIEILKNK